ncbi:MAG: NADP-dependent oxidoreductase [Rhodospirillales bacterium]
MSDTMRAAAVGGFGGVEQIKIKDMPVPAPAGGEVLVRVHGAGINPIDNKFRNREVPAPIWQNPDFPVIAGWDLSGTVAEAAGGFAAGDDVYGMVRFPHFAGTCAEFATAPAAHLSLKPQNIDHLHAAGVPLAALTAWQAIEAGGLKSGQTALIHAAAGGVGHFAVQIAKNMGVRVIATASARNEDFVMSLGAEKFIDYTAADYGEEGSGADFVFHTIAADLIPKSMACLKADGFLAAVNGPLKDDDADAAGVRAAFISVHQDEAHLAAITALIETGSIKPHVDRVYPLAETAAAHAHVEGGHTRGKVVVEIGGG